MTQDGDLLRSIGRLFIASSRCEWYIGEILVESKLGKGHDMTWSDGTKRLEQNAKEIGTLLSSDLDGAIKESVRLSEILRKFRNKFTHGFLGKFNNAEGWIELKEKMLANAPGSKITHDEINDMANQGDLALAGYKHILLGLYHRNGKM